MEIYTESVERRYFENFKYNRDAFSLSNISKPGMKEHISLMVHFFQFTQIRRKKGVTDHSGDLGICC